jgi:hypothetical protein
MAVEALGAERSHPAFGVGVRIRSLDRCPDHPDSLGAEDLVEGVRKLRVAVVDEETEGVLVAELHDVVARLLRHPASVGIRGGGDVLDPARRERDEEQHVDPLEEHGLDVRKSQASTLPAWARKNARHVEWFRCGAGLKTSFEQHLPHRGRRDGDAQSHELADDPSVSPVRVLAAEPQDQSS